MDFEVVEVRYTGDYNLWLRFKDGTEGPFDCLPELRGPVFQPLRDIAYFARVRVNPELGTISWPNDADLSPVYLHEFVRVAAWAADRARLVADTAATP